MTRQRRETRLKRLIDLESFPVQLVLDRLLQDKTTKQNIIFATDAYSENGEDFAETSPITVEKLLGFKKIKIQPRVEKAADEQLARIAKAVRPETKLIYSEVLSNPTLTLVDLKAVAEIAHKNGAYLMVDNTFTTPIAIRPIDFGADIVINSLTKFLNGHSDAIGGSITTTQALCDKIQPVAMLLGTPGDPFSSWLIHRGINTASVRMPQAMHTAEKLAATLAANKHVSRVNHPSLPTYPQKELADRMFGKNGYCAMLSFIVPENLEKIDQFMLTLKFPKYAPTLGGLHTTLSHPVTSSHMGVPDETRRKMGITPGMIRVSVGIEDADDLAADFENALKVFD